MIEKLIVMTQFRDCFEAWGQRTNLLTLVSTFPPKGQFDAILSQLNPCESSCNKVADKYTHLAVIIISITNPNLSASAAKFIVYRFFLFTIIFPFQLISRLSCNTGYNQPKIYIHLRHCHHASISQQITLRIIHSSTG